MRDRMDRRELIEKVRERLELGGGARGESAAVREIVSKHGGKSWRVIAMLQDVQARFGYLPEDELRAVSKALDMPLTRVYGIATFYKAFRLAPRGRHEICLCTGTACHVRGAERVKDAIERELGVEVGGTTADSRFSFEEVRCLGCCGQAPVMTVDEELITKLDPLSIGKALERFE